MAFILYFAGLRKKRISEGFEHRFLNSSLELRGFIKDYFKQLPMVAERLAAAREVRGQSKGRRSAVDEHRGAQSPSEAQ